MAIDAAKTVSVGVKAHFDLRSISPFLPEATVATNVDTSLVVSFTLEEAEWRSYQKLPPAIAEGLSDPTTDPKKQARLARARDRCASTPARSSRRCWSASWWPR